MSAAQIEEMLRLQGGLNAQINQEWKAAKNPWGRAIWIEAAELLDHIGWKWWKKQTPNIPQAHIELVDIWHFILSQYAEQTTPEQYAKLAEHMAHRMTDRSRRIGVYKGNVVSANDLSLAERIDFMASIAASGDDCLPYFAAVCEAAELSFEQMRRMYVSKNVLNVFRQHNGYKDGTYIKIWNGAEDNVHLEQLLDSHPNLAGEDIYKTLAATYQRVKEAA